MPSEVDDGYFNDLSRQPRKGSESSISPPESKTQTHPTDQSELPKTKRIACVICRKRKLKCDGQRPKCATCNRLGHNCAYDEVRRKSGPKRGYVKELEARLAQVETQLSDKPNKNGKRNAPARDPSIPEEDEMDMQSQDVNMSMPSANDFPSGEPNFGHQSPYSGATSNPIPEATRTSEFAPDMSFGLDDNFNWEMIGLGLEEPMPTQEAIDELTTIYFDKVHASLPMIHKYRYYSKLSLAPMARPPICLRYAMWALAAMVTEKYMRHDDIFYRRARKYVDLDEMKGQGEGFVTLAHAQTYVLLATYEFKLMYFPRAWMSAGRATRMSLMEGLNRVDGVGMDVKQCLPPPQDWTEREERRRTFWMAYCVDRYASIGTGWPMTIDERDIMTSLPASEEAFESGIEQSTQMLGEAMTHQQISQLSVLAGVVYVTHFFGLNLTHLHRPEADDEEGNLQGKFWKRHRHMDNTLSNLLLALPHHLRLPNGVRDSNVVFTNFCAHTSTICLHQAAIFKAEKNQLPASCIENSRSRCLMAAGEVVNIMRLTSHLDISSMNPYLVFCLYVAARVLLQYLKSKPDDSEAKTSLEFLLTAMAALRRKVPLAESFMIQLQLDIEGNGLDLLLHNPDFSTMVKEKAHLHTDECNMMNERKAKGLVMPEIIHSRQFHDFRAPDTWRPGLRADDFSQTASVRSDEPRQTSYAMSNIQLNARENAATYPYTPADANSTEPTAVQGILPGNIDWNVSANRLNQSNDFNDLNHPVGLNPLINNNINVNAFEADGSDQTRQTTSRHNSQGLTPQSTNSAYHSSPNTSYSPPTVTDEDPSSAMGMSSAGGPQASISSALDESFKVPAGWETGGTGMTPGFSGLTPNSAEWVLQGVNWETGMTPK